MRTPPPANFVKSRSFRCVLLLILLVHFAALTSWAQVDKATINGIVTDQSGAVIPGVNVTVTSADTGARFTGKSNDAGVYRVSGLPVGTYSLIGEKGGFKRLERSGLPPSHSAGG
jgi:hypothetical protein